MMNAKSKFWWPAICLAALFSADGSGSVRQTQASGLLIADGGLGGVLEIKEQDVSVVINNGIAVTEIRQVFLNTEKRIVEALYTFPVPNGASVSNFSMIINGKEMIGEVVEKKRARQIYESYKAVKRDPGLLEQVDYKSFELRVFPIAAGAEQHIKITYYQQLDFDHDNATYVYPLATSTRAAVNEKTTGKFAMTLDVKSEIPITKLFSPSHENAFAITNHTPNYTRASLEIPQGDLSRDVVVAFDTERPHTGIDLIASKRSNEDGYFMLTMAAGKELKEYGAGMDYVFVVDISGSMENEGKLTLSRNVVKAFIGDLQKEDRFEVMTFNSAPQTHFQSLTPVTDEAKRTSGDFLLAQRAKGGTVLRPAVLTAYKYKDADRPLNVVILSDGMTENKEQAELLALIGKAPAGTRVFCIGVGNDVNRPLLKQLAEGAGGLAAFVSQQDDFMRQSQAFRRKLMRPVATNVNISFEGVEIYDVLPKTLPDLFYGSPLRMVGRYKKSGQIAIAVNAEVMGQPMVQNVKAQLPASEEANPEIERMWAFSQVQQHMDNLRRNGPSESTEGEIVRLCEGYSIVSEYASFIVLENDSEYKRWSIQQRNATRVQRDNIARKELQTQLERMREESLSAIGPKETKLVTTQVSRPDAPIASDSIRTSSQPQITPSAPSSPTDLNFIPANSSSNPASSNRGGNTRSGGGGGAIDPITGLLAAGLAGAAAWANRRKKKQTGATNNIETMVATDA